MEIKYPSTILNQSKGTTDTEKYLSRLCQNSFLSMWSFPNIYRDQGNSSNKGDGKEVCDLLVIFDNHVIIFSDKACSFPSSENIEVDWSRWYRKAVKKSADQIWGAERWLFSHPDRIFLDKQCQKKFPLLLPDKSKAKIHRIVTAHAVSKKCISELGGSGSLMIVPSIVGDMHFSDKSRSCLPFTIGQVDPQKGYVHVFDDTTLEIVMKTLDTVSDFVSYLGKKEAFITSGKLLSASGEDDLLAYYLKHVDYEGQHVFHIDSDADAIIIREGIWNNFVNSPERKAQIEADEISYSWDKLIELFLTHIFNGTSYYLSHIDISEQEKGLRLLARENRTRRRMLSLALHEILEKTPAHMRVTRTLLPSHLGDPYYLFLLLPRREHIDEKNYRDVRGSLLQQYCMITKLNFPEALDIVGIATESGIDSRYRSEDFLYYNARGWTKEEKTQAQKYETKLKELGMIGERTMTKKIIKEYPVSVIDKNKLKGSARNKPCPCGSGKKNKKCCGLV